MPVLALIALGATVPLMAGSATASSVTTVKSTVTITSGEGTQFTGKVNAAKKKCRAGRIVKLYSEAGSTGRMGDPLAGTVKTNATGAWTMDGSFLSAVYYAQVAAVLVHINGAPYRCAGDLSIAMHY